MSCTCSAAAMSGNEERQAKRQKCYERCLSKHGWKPVCVFSPRYPKPTSHMPEARWVRQGREHGHLAKEGCFLGSHCIYCVNVNAVWHTRWSHGIHAAWLPLIPSV